MNEHVVLKRSADDDLYGADFFEWTRHQADLLRTGRLDRVDIENIAEEIESLGKNDRRGIESQLARLIAHLLKLQFSTDVPPRQGWKDSVIDARLAIELALDDSPSLRRRMPEFFERQWRHGYQRALIGLSSADQPALTARSATPPIDLEQVLDPDFFPGD